MLDYSKKCVGLAGILTTSLGEEAHWTFVVDQLQLLY